MHREVVDGLLVGPEGLKEDKGIGVVDTDRSIGVGGDEISRNGEIGRGEEGEGGYGSRVVVEGTDGGGCGEVVELDGVVVAARGSGGAGGGDGGDGGEVGRVGEKRG